MANFASLAQVKNYMGISGSADDVLLTSLLERTTKLIQVYVGRDLISATYTNVRLSGSRTKDLLLPQYPVSAVSAVTEIYDEYSGSELLLTELLHYIIRNKTETTDNPGILTRVDGKWLKGVDNYKITYTAGYSTIPVDLVQAQIDWVSFIYRNKDMRVGVSGYRLGDFSINFKDNSVKDSQGNSLPVALPPDDVRLVLDNYRDPRMESTFDDCDGD